MKVSSGLYSHPAPLSHPDVLQVLVSEFSRAGPVMGGMPLPGGFTRTWLEVLQSSTTWLAACWDRLEPEALDQETLDDIKVG